MARSVSELSPEDRAQYNSFIRTGDLTGAQTFLTNAGGTAQVAPPPAASGPSVPYNINLYDAWSRSQGALDFYEQNVRPFEQIEGLSQGLEDYGAYQGYDWEADPLAYEAMSYDPTQYDFASAYNPQEYTPYDYDLLGAYQGPGEYNPYEYSTPELADVDSIQGMVGDVYAGAKEKQYEDIGAQYRGIREETERAAAQTQGRREQTAALTAGLGVEEEKAKRAAALELARAEAESRLGVAGQEQQLGFQKSATEAGYESERQARQAAELSQAYGFDVDEARYRAGLSGQEQQLEAGEEQYSADFGEKQAQNRAALAQAQQQAQTEEGRYATEFARGEKMTNLGIEQWLQEQKAAEDARKYESGYALQQDIASTKAQEYEMNRAAQMDYWNAVLQGGQSAQNTFSQAATYYTNLPGGERGRLDQQRMAQEQLARQNGQQPYSGATTGYQKANTTTLPPGYGSRYATRTQAAPTETNRTSVTQPRYSAVPKTQTQKPQGFTR